MLSLASFIRYIWMQNKRTHLGNERSSTHSLDSRGVVGSFYTKSCQVNGGKPKKKDKYNILFLEATCLVRSVAYRYTKSGWNVYSFARNFGSYTVNSAVHTGSEYCMHALWCSFGGGAHVPPSSGKKRISHIRVRSPRPQISKRISL